MDELGGEGGERIWVRQARTRRRLLDSGDVVDGRTL